MNSAHTRFPIGAFEIPEMITETDRSSYIHTIEQFPELLRNELTGCHEKSLDEPYREGGWTVRQVVHHCADSHMNALIRFKLALTEHNPAIKPYAEAEWAELSDSVQFPIEPSLRIIQGVHARLSQLLRTMTDDQFALTYYHPEHNMVFRLDQVAANYDWHCRHHLAHIRLVTRK